MSSFDSTSDLDVPQLPVVDLITRRAGSKEDQVNEGDVYFSQYNWRAVKLYRLEPDRRKEICVLLVSLAKKLAPELRGSEAYQLWEKVAKDPTYPDEIFNGQDSR